MAAESSHDNNAFSLFVALQLRSRTEYSDYYKDLARRVGSDLVKMGGDSNRKLVLCRDKKGGGSLDRTPPFL